MISSIICIVRRLFEIVKLSSHHVFIKLRHVVLSFVFAAFDGAAGLVAAGSYNFMGLVFYR
jgi:hypothetical protein